MAYLHHIYIKYGEDKQTPAPTPAGVEQTFSRLLDATRGRR